MTGFGVDPRELHKFAEGQFDRQNALASAANTASGVSLGGETFGQLLQWFADDAQDKARETVDNLRKLVEGVGRAADDTKATALTYEAYEDSNRNRFGGER
ncbi:hypothetical protein AB0M48_41280 [Lentzea sp. NPDC051208]|uniref:hypothetical protein n=1 Tax=Lentzea sp. NPDC051208 TaxID=3154642 RepID=UPI00342EC7D1